MTYCSQLIAAWSLRYKLCLLDLTAAFDTVRVGHHMPRPSPPPVGAVAPRAAEPTAAPADGNVAAVSHAQYVPTLTAAAACV